MHTPTTRRWTLPRSTRAAVALLLVAMGGAPQRAASQIANPSRSGRHLVIAPYAWLAGIGGETGVRDLSADVNVTFIELLDHLRFAGMGLVEGGYGSWLAGVDIMYTSVRVDDLLPLTGTQFRLELSSQLLISNLYAGYSFDSETLAIDVMAGARVWNVDAGLNIEGADASAERKHDGGWVDALIGARARWRPRERWLVSAAADGGGGGSQNTAGALVMALYDISSRWSVFGGYRYIHLDRIKDDFFFDGHLLGPALGAVYRW